MRAWTADTGVASGQLTPTLDFLLYWGVIIAKRNTPTQHGSDGDCDSQANVSGYIVCVDVNQKASSKCQNCFHHSQSSVSLCLCKTWFVCLSWPWCRLLQTRWWWGTSAEGQASQKPLHIRIYQHFQMSQADLHLSYMSARGKPPDWFRMLRVTLFGFMLPQHCRVKPKKNATLKESKDQQPQPRLSALTSNSKHKVI